MPKKKKKLSANFCNVQSFILCEKEGAQCIRKDTWDVSATSTLKACSNSLSLKCIAVVNDIVILHLDVTRL